ncbi:hypothetical protein FB446DRAFT_655994, partial [Lentinula raphanica]
MHIGGGANAQSSSVFASDKVTALQAEVAELKALIAQGQSRGHPGSKGPANPDLVCTNTNCRGRGHTIENCWKLGGGKQGQYPKWWKGKRDAPLLTPPVANQANPSETITPGSHYALTTVVHTALNARTSGPIRTFADTGASAHFFRDRESFKTY